MIDLEKLTPFQFFALTNFPYIEADFDALTNYQLFCEITKYLNGISASQNDVITNFNELLQNWNDFSEAITSEWTETKDYIDNYFENLDVQEEINNKLDQMASDGTLLEVIQSTVIGEARTITENWLAQLTPSTEVIIDATLSVAGACADAKATGDAISEVKGALDEEIARNDNDNYSIYSYLPREVIRTVGDIDSAVVGEQISLGTTDWCEVFTIPVEEYQKFICTIRVTRPKYHVVFTDENDIVLSANLFGNGTPTVYTNYTFISPENAKKLYICTHSSSDINSGDLSKVQIYLPLIDEKLDAETFYENIVSTEAFKRYIDLSLVVQGYYNMTTVDEPPTYITTRACTKPLKVNKGDSIFINDYNYKAAYGLFSEDGTLLESTQNYIFVPFVFSFDGIVKINIVKSDTSATVNINDLAGKLIVDKAENVNVSTIVHNDLIKGYIDANSNIQPHNYRAVNVRFIKAKKGDIFRILDPSLACNVYEYDSIGTLITTSGDYYSGKYSAPDSIYGHYVAPGDHPCGDYIIQNDCFIRTQISAIGGDSSFDFESINDPCCIIHVNHDQSIMSAENTKFRFPKGLKKSRIISENTLKEMQDGTVINNKLWVAVDDYQNNQSFKIFNIETGTIEKTIPHTLGHASSIDYNVNNDTLLIIGESELYLLKNPSTEMESISISDCDVITLSNDVYLSSCCWGEDNQTVFILNGATGTTEQQNMIWKIILGMESGQYTGSYSIEKSYKLIVIDGTDTYFMRNNANYVQGCEYDGYLYLGYGTNGHNFLVIDFDETLNEARVVGNYMKHIYSENRTEQSCEPQIVALNGNKIILGVRDWTNATSLISEYDRCL